MLTKAEVNVTLNKLALRYKEAKGRLATEQDTVDNLKDEILAIMQEAKQGEKSVTDDFVIENKLTSKRVFLKKEEFIKMNSPQIFDEKGNPRVNGEGEPILDLEVGREVYAKYQRTTEYYRFDVKRRVTE